MVYNLLLFLLQYKFPSLELVNREAEKKNRGKSTIWKMIKARAFPEVV